MKPFYFLMMLMTEGVHWRTSKRCHICLGDYLVHIHSYRTGIWRLHHICQKCGDVDESLHNDEGLLEYIQYELKGLI